jgi:FMN phosphatase YigB (HAD superfamily)
MVIGVDFDNTIVCYDQLFHQVAVEQGLIPASVPATKSEVRGYLERRGQGDAWTQLQGHVYGLRLPAAVAFPGALDSLRRCARRGLPLYIISHKTRHPALGPPYNLHQAAHQWLETHGFYDPQDIGLSREHVFFELTQQAKVERIHQVGCSFFIDDLPEVLTNPKLPAQVRRILFDPHGKYAQDERFHHAATWAEIDQLILCNNPPF